MSFPSGLWLLLSRSPIETKDTKLEDNCDDLADKYCPNKLRNFYAWKQYYQRCIQLSWAAISHNNNAFPYSDVSCRCYNGCVSDRFKDERNVGAYCHVQSTIIHCFIGC
ncbi:hypothetical protein V8E36_002103 [Tilletia maclaganii]